MNVSQRVRTRSRSRSRSRGASRVSAEIDNPPKGNNDPLDKGGEEEPLVPPKNNPPPMDKKKKNNWLTIVAGVILALLLCAVVGGLVWKYMPRKVKSQWDLVSDEMISYTKLVSYQKECEGTHNLQEVYSRFDELSIPDNIRNALKSITNDYTDVLEITRGKNCAHKFLLSKSNQLSDLTQHMDTYAKSVQPLKNVNEFKNIVTEWMNGFNSYLVALENDDSVRQNNILAKIRKDTSELEKFFSDVSGEKKNHKRCKINCINGAGDRLQANLKGHCKLTDDQAKGAKALIPFKDLNDCTTRSNSTLPCR